jgi:hypothetical protein
MHDFWTFLQNENNRIVLAWLGGGLVALAGALWTVFKFVSRKDTDKHQHTPTVSATHGSVAVGRDIRDSKIDTSRG